MKKRGFLRKLGTLYLQPSTGGVGKKGIIWEAKEKIDIKQVFPLEKRTRSGKKKGQIW